MAAVNRSIRCDIRGKDSSEEIKKKSQVQLETKKIILEASNSSWIILTDVKVFSFYLKVEVTL